MSRAFHPPDTLTKEDVQKIRAVRGDIWTDGLYGMGMGSVVGLLAHCCIRFLNRGRGSGSASTANTAAAARMRQAANLKNRNMALAWGLGGGVLGSLLFSTARGKNEVHNLHPIFRRGAKPPNDDDAATNSPMQSRLEQELKGREKNRLFRRTTLQNSMRRKTGGLSDSHGGHWVTEDEDRKD